MLHAQGSITVRRRPKDGNPGADAVRYWLVPSVSQIKKTDDGKYHPTSITCEKRKQTGNSIPIATSEGTLKYQIGYTDNSTSSITNYSSAITIPANCQWVKFVLYVNNIDVATETVAVVADGESNFLLDLSNEMQGIPCNSSGTPTMTGTLASTTATVYKGSKVDTGWTFSKEDTDCTSTIDASTGEVSVTAISADRASVKVIATKGTQTLSAVMSLYKVKAGTPGSNPVVYSIESSASAISRSKTGVLNPTSITAYKLKTVGNTTTRTTDMVLKYQREGQDTSETILTGQGGEIKGMTSACTAVILTIYSAGGTVLDKERIPIVKDGNDGSDAYLIDLDNEVEGIPCNSSGTPTMTGTLASTTATVYKGSKVDTGWTFSKEDTDCTSTIDASTGEVSVTAISADRASVKVIATKGTQTLSAVMSLYKVKPGGTGTSPVVYSLEVSDSAISRDSDGNLSPTSITVYKNKTVGSTKSRTQDYTLTYQRIGQDANPIQLVGQGGEIKDISSDCTAIEVKYKNGNTVLDSERIPIVKDGDNGTPGKDAVTIIVSPENIEFNISKSVPNQKVRVDVYKGESQLAYNDFLCSTLSSKDTITTGLSWGFKVEDGLFYYTLRYLAGNDVNVEIPFTVTIDEVKYNKVLRITTVQNGSQGIQGIQGCIYRQTEWSKGFEFHNDSELTSGIRYIDIALIKDKTAPTGYKAYMCRLTHLSTDSNNPTKEFENLGNNAGNETEHWTKLNSQFPIYTPFIFADNGVITLMQSNQILIGNDDGVISAGLSGSVTGDKIRIWAGSATPDNAPFKVDENGKMTASNAEIVGNIKATSGNIGNWFIYQDCIASTHGTINGVESDDYTSPDFRPDVILNGATGELVLYSDKYPRLRLSNASVTSLFNEHLLPQATLEKYFSKSQTPYIPYANGMFRYGIGNLGTISLGYMEEGSKIVISRCFLTFVVPALESNNSATVTSTVNGTDLKVIVKKNGVAVANYTGTSGMSKSKGETLSLYFGNKTFTVPEGGEGNYSLEVELEDVGFIVSSSGNLKKFTIHGSLLGSFQHGGFNKTVIGNDGFGSFWQDAGFIFSQSGLVTRIGNIGFRINSSGIQKCTNAATSNPTWVNI